MHKRHLTQQKYESSHGMKAKTMACHDNQIIDIYGHSIRA